MPTISRNFCRCICHSHTQARARKLQKIGAKTDCLESAGSKTKRWKNSVPFAPEKQKRTRALSQCTVAYMRCEPTTLDGDPMESSCRKICVSQSKVWTQTRHTAKRQGRWATDAATHNGECTWPKRCAANRGAERFVIMKLMRFVVS